MPYYDYRCKTCEVIIEINELSPPSCPNGHGEMRRVFTPCAVKIRGGTPRHHGERAIKVAKEYERKAWEAEREYDAKEAADNDKQIAQDTEKWKKIYVGNEMHIKNGNPDEPSTRAFKEAGVKPRKKSTIKAGFKHAPGGDQP